MLVNGQFVQENLMNVQNKSSISTHIRALRVAMWNISSRGSKNNKLTHKMHLHEMHFVCVMPSFEDDSGLKETFNQASMEYVTVLKNGDTKCVNMDEFYQMADKIDQMSLD